MNARSVFRILVSLAVVGAVVVAVIKLQEKRKLANEAADDIEAQLAALDPVTRAAVIARLGKDAATARRR